MTDHATLGDVLMSFGGWVAKSTGDGFDLIVMIAVCNIILSGLHWCLWQIKDKTETKWDDRAVEILDWLLTIINWVMANRRNPISRTEVKQALRDGHAENRDP